MNTKKRAARGTSADLRDQPSLSSASLIVGGLMVAVVALFSFVCLTSAARPNTGAVLELIFMGVVCLSVGVGSLVTLAVERQSQSAAWAVAFMAALAATATPTVLLRSS